MSRSSTSVDAHNAMMHSVAKRQYQCGNKGAWWEGEWEEMAGKGENPFTCNCIMENNRKNFNKTQ